MIGTASIVARFAAILTAASAAPAASSATVTGYAGLELNASFEAVLAKVGEDAYRPEDVAKCLADMPLKGCILVWRSKLVPFERKNGVPYVLDLSFSKWGRLTDIDLVYWRSGGITRSQCLEVHNHSVEWVSHEYGPLYNNLPPGAERLVRKSELAIDLSTIPRPASAAANSRSRHNFVAVDTMYMGDECRVDVGFVA